MVRFAGVGYLITGDAAAKQNRVTRLLKSAGDQPTLFAFSGCDGKGGLQETYIPEGQEKEAAVLLIGQDVVDLAQKILRNPEQEGTKADFHNTLAHVITEVMAKKEGAVTSEFHFPSLRIPGHTKAYASTVQRFEVNV